MIRPDSLQTYVRAQPFKPFRIVMNSGRHYDVRHPEMIRVGKDVCVYYYADSPDAPFERFETVSIMLMEHVENLPQAAPSSGGGNLN